MQHETELGWRISDASMGDIFAYSVCNDLAFFLRSLKPIDIITTPPVLLMARLEQESLTHVHYLKRCREELPNHIASNPAIPADMDGLAELADRLVTDVLDAQRMAVLVSSSAVVAASNYARNALTDGAVAMRATQDLLKATYKSHAKQWAMRAVRIISRHPEVPRSIALLRVRKDPASGKYAMFAIRDDL